MTMRDEILAEEKAADGAEPRRPFGIARAAFLGIALLALPALAACNGDDAKTEAEAAGQAAEGAAEDAGAAVEDAADAAGDAAKEAEGAATSN